MSEAREDGNRSFKAYRAMGAEAPPVNPYSLGTPEFHEWNHGYTDAQYDLTDRIGNE